MFLVLVLLSSAALNPQQAGVHAHIFLVLLAPPLLAIVLRSRAILGAYITVFWSLTVLLSVAWLNILGTDALWALNLLN